MVPRLNGRKVPPHVQLLLFGVFCLSVVAAFIFCVFRPSMAELNRLSAQNAVSRQNLRQLEEAQRRHAVVAAERNDLFYRSVEAFSQFPRESDLPHVMAAVDRLAQSRGAKTHLISYAGAQWEKGEGRVQVTAVFTGEYDALTALVVDLKRALPSVQVDQVKITAQALPNVKATVAPEQVSEENSLAARLRKIFGLTTFIQESLVLPPPDTSPLEIDHLEARVVFTVHMVEEPKAPAASGNEKAPATAQPAALALAVSASGQWYARQVERWRGVTGDPFRPSARAVELVYLAQLVERYKSIKINGIAHTGNKWVAVVEFMNRSHRVQPGDTLGDAVVSRIDENGITLNIAGREIAINLGGEQG